MKRRVRGAYPAMGVAAAIWALAAVAADDALNNADILRLTKAGIGDVAIMAMIGSSPSDFDTSVDAVVELAEAGVGDAVITAMVSARNEPLPLVDGAARVEPSGTRRAPGSVFWDRLSEGGKGPSMVVIPAGRFRMGCRPSNDDDCDDEERPMHDVTIVAPFALSVHEVTFADYDQFTYPEKVDDEGWGRGRRPVVNVSWNDVQDYVEWLSAQTGEHYRLPSEAEWEYAARAGTVSKYHWGDEIGTNRAHCDGCGTPWDARETVSVASFAPNSFGLYDMHGNVSERVQDCWNDNYHGAPDDGSAWTTGDCAYRVVRGGGWVTHDSGKELRAAFRVADPSGAQFPFVGFRVARALTR